MKKRGEKGVFIFLRWEMIVRKMKFIGWKVK